MIYPQNFFLEGAIFVYKIFNIPSGDGRREAGGLDGNRTPKSTTRADVLSMKMPHKLVVDADTAPSMPRKPAVHPVG